MSWFFKKIGLSGQTQEVDAVSNASRVTVYDTNGVVVTPATSANQTNGTQKTAVTTLPIDPTSSGTIAAVSQNVALQLSGQSAAVIQVSGTWSGTLLFEGSLDGTVWNAINATIAASNSPLTTGGTNGAYRLSPASFQQIRISSIAWNSGTANISMRAAMGTSGVFVNQIAPVVLTDKSSGNSVGVSSLTDLLVAQRYTVNSDSLADGISNQWAATTANGGTVTSVGGEALIQTSANAIGSAQIVGMTVEYFPGQVSWLNSAVRLGDTGSVGNVRRWGAYTVNGAGVPQEGFYYELNGTSFEAVTVKAGVATGVPTTSWSRVSTSPYTLDAIYLGGEIRWTANSVFFLVNNVLRHSVSGTTTPLTSTLNFPITAQSINTSAATNRVLGIRNVGIGRFGTPPNAPHLTGYLNVQKDVEYNTGQTGTTIWTPNVGKKFVVTDITIATGGAVGGVVTLWQGASADTIFTQGTDPAVFRGEFSPSATLKERFAKQFKVPFVSTTVDHQLKITTSSSITIYLQITGYEI